MTLTASVGSVTKNADGTWNWSFDTTDGPDDTQTVTITATDSDGAATSTSFTLTVANTPPAIAANAAVIAVVEGATASNTGSFADAGNDTVTLTASSGTVVDNGNGTWTSLDTADGPDDSRTVTITATDSDGAQSATSFSLTVTNSAPALAAASASVVVNEGATATNSGTVADPGTDTVVLSTSIGTIVDNGNGTWNWSYDTTDGPDNSQTVTITATDSDGAASTTTFALTVNNAAPVLVASSSAVTVSEGATANNSGTVADAGTDTFTLAASVGVIVDNGNGTWNWSFNTTDGPDQSQTVTITATDSDGAQSTTTFGLTVNNAAPGLSVGISASAFDAGTGTLTLSGTASLAVYQAALRNVAYTNTSDNPDTSNRTDTMSVTGGVLTGTVTRDIAITAVNDTPTIAVANATVTVIEGSTAINSGTIADLESQTLTLTASSGTVTNNGNGTWSWSLDTADGPRDTRSVTITATDTQGAAASTTFGLTVANAAPTLVLNPIAVTDEGSLATLTGTIADPGTSDTFSLSVNWGDPNSPNNTETYTFNASATGSQTFTLTHRYLDDSATGAAQDPFTVNTTVTDRDGASDSAAIAAPIVNISPTIAFNPVAGITENGIATVTGTISDPGTVDTFTLSVNWGDPDSPFNTETYTFNASATGSQTFTLTHRYLDDSPTGPAQDPFTMTATLVDDDTGSVTSMASVQVFNHDPTLILNPVTAIDESGVVTLSGAIDDPSGLDTYVLSINWGDPLSPNNTETYTFNASAAGAQSFSFTHQYLDNPNDGAAGNFTINATLTDDDTGANSKSRPVLVRNIAPDLTNGGNVAVSKGQTATNTGTWNDPGVDVVTLSASVGTVVRNANGTWDWSYDTTDGPDNSQAVTITATDSDGAVSTTTFAVTVGNAAPTIGVDNPTITVSEGATASNTGVVSDQGNDVVSLTASVGTITNNGNGTWSWSFNSTDGPDNSQTVTITATDSDGAVSMTTFALVVNNSVPIVAADNATVTVSEGATATNTGTLSDSGSDTLTLSASTGTITNNGNGTWNWSLATTDGPDDSQTVTVTATDSDGAVSTTTFALTVSNVAPSISAANASVSVSEGAAAANSGTFSEPGVDVVSLSASIGTVVKNGNGTWSWSFDTTDGPDDSQTVTITATDSDGAASTVTFGLVVGNAAPNIDVDNATVVVSEGTTAGNTGTVADSGDDTVALSASVGSITNNGNGTWSWSFDTTDGPDNSQTVTVTATDSDGAVSSTTFALTVNNAAPAVAANNATVAVTEGATASNSGTVSDAGADTVSLAASIGTIIDNGNGTWSWSFDTTDGPDDSQTVTITATDSDGEASTTTFALVVNNAAPNLAADNATVTVAEGAAASNTGTFGDPGTDFVNLSASVGSINDNDNGNGTWNWSFGTTDGPDDSQTVTITATDSDGAVSTTTFALVVTNVAPSVAADNASVTVSEGATAANTGSATDPGADTLTLSASIGTIVDNQDGTWTWTLNTSDGPDDSQTVTVTATDNDGLQTTTTFALTVNNAAPTVSADNASVAVSEGSTAANSGTVSDAGDDTVSLSASIGTISDNGNGTWNWSFNPSDGPDESQTVTVTATDSDGLQSTTTFALTVNNVAPSVSADNTTLNVSDSATAANTGTFADAGNDALTVTASVGAVSQNITTGVWSWSFVPSAANDGQSVTITATDSDGAASTTSFVLNVTNVAPLVAVDNASVTVSEGATAANSGTFGDTPGDTVTLSASIGSISRNNASGTWSWSYPTSDGPPESTTVAITAQDSAGASTTVTFALTVTNVAPTLTFDPVTAINENGIATVTGTISDPGTGDTFTLSVNWDDPLSPNNAETYTFNTSATGSQTFALTHQYLDDRETGAAQNPFSMSATLTDDDGATDTATAAIQVFNIAPALNFDPVTPIDENGVAVVTGTITDVSPRDTFTPVVDWKDPNSTNSVETFTFGASATGSQSFTLTHQYLDDSATGAAQDPYQMTATLTDDDTGSHTAVAPIQVFNIDPSLVFDPVTPISENGVATVTGTLFDASRLDTFVLEVDWGDPLSPNNIETYSFGASATGQQTFTLTHQYLDDNPTGVQQFPFIATATAIDDDTGQRSATVHTMVFNHDPTLTLNPVVSINEGGVATLTGSITDPSPLDTFTLDINWGDPASPNNVETYTFSASATGTQNFSLTHQYLDNAAGTQASTFQIDATLTDDDTGSDAAGQTVIVNNVAPTVTIAGDVTVNEGQTATNNGVWSDPGVDDVVLSASIGAITRNSNGTWAWELTTTDSDQSQVVTITATDSDGAASSTTFNLTVNNTDPIITSFSSNAATPCDSSTVVTVAGAFVDAGITDTHTAVVDWGDGTPSHAVSVVDNPDGSGTLAGNHVYSTGGIYTISVVLTDDDGGVANATTTAVIIGVGLNGRVLQIVGTDQNDQVSVSRHGSRIRVKTKFGRGPRERSTFEVDDIDAILIDVCDGNDHVRVDRRINLPATVFGGSGNDHIRTGSGDDVVDGGAGHDHITTDGGHDTIIDLSGNNHIRSGDGNDTVTTGSGHDWISTDGGDDTVISGNGNDWVSTSRGDDVIFLGAGHDDVWAGSGNDIVVGGDGRDWIDGGSGRDIIIGGKDRDWLRGQNGDDLLIGGTTAHDDNLAALHAIYAEWTSTASYLDRINHLRTGTGPHLNGVKLAANETVWDDESRDTLWGDRGRDWFFADRDTLHCDDRLDIRRGEVFDQLEDN